jgi:N-acetylneuraminic acid mutarotase
VPARGLAILLLLSACSASSPQENRTVDNRSVDGGLRGWRSLAPLGGGPRQENGVVALNGRVYVVGGFTAEGSIVGTVEAYERATDTWMPVRTLPRPLHHPNVAAVGNRIYVLGALVENSFREIGDVYLYDPGTNGWTQLSSMPPGTERGAGAAAAIGNKIYLVGGIRGGVSVADFSAYDTATGTWEILPSVGEPRDHLVAGVVGGKFYAIGGRNNGALRGNVDEFDPGAHTWSAKTRMLTPRAGCAAAVVGNRILVAGGEGNPNASSGIFSENEAFDPARNSWEALEPMLTPRHGTGGAAIDNIFYVPGGANRQNFGAVATNESYMP